jgi:hypothetical protein
MKALYLVIISGMLCGCSPHSTEEFQREGETQLSLLVQDLQAIETREQLTTAAPRLKKHFESLVALILEARRFQEENPDDAGSESVVEPGIFSLRLEEELRRLYQMEGGKEVIEKAQHEALVKLDAYERVRLKKRERGKTSH